MSIELHDLGQLEVEEGDPATAASTSASQGADSLRKKYIYIINRTCSSVRVFVRMAMGSSPLNTQL